MINESAYIVDEYGPLGQTFIFCSRLMKGPYPGVKTLLQAFVVKSTQTR